MTLLHRAAAFLVVLPLALAASGAASAMTMAEREVTCPLTGEKFKTHVIASYTQFGVRLDMRPYGAMMAPAPIPKCPGSGFPVFRENFSGAELTTLRALVETAEYKAARAAHTDYYMVVWIERRLGVAVEPWRLALTLLRAAWQAEGGDPARLAAYRAEARDAFDAAAAEAGAPAERKLTAQLLAAEMDRLLGRFDKALARLEALSGTAWPEKTPLKSVAAQIERWARAGNAQPQNYLSERS
jgi:hypothetical protein